MSSYYEAEALALYHGDCRTVLAGLPECSVDAIVTDPPYGLEFMNVAWDTFEKGQPRQRNEWGDFGSREHARHPSDVARIQRNKGLSFQTWSQSWAMEALRVLKPGAHLLAFGSPRTYHRMVCAIEDAGFEIRDCLQWIFGQGFPKSLDVSKAIDKAAGAERQIIGPRRWEGRMPNGGALGQINDDSWIAKTDAEIGGQTAPATDLARQWEGWGTALKPAYEPIVLARKPLQGTVAANVLAHGTGGLNIDGCRIEGEPWKAHRATGLGSVKFFTEGLTPEIDKAPHEGGRWPANVLLDEEAARLLDAMSGATGAYAPVRGTEPTADGFSGLIYGTAKGRQEATFYGDAGGASRFLFVSKEKSWSRNVASDAGVQCGQCGPVTALSHAKASPSKEPPAIPGRDSIDNSESSIQRPNLASNVERLDGIATTPTTPSFCGSCGSVLPATDAPINSEQRAKAEGDNDQVLATRFLYSAKTSRAEREYGLGDLEPARRADAATRDSAPGSNNPRLRTTERHNDHPTVKPLDLMRWLVRLVTPPGGLVCDPFVGSGSTGMAALDEGFRFIGIDLEERYLEIAKRRIARRHLIETLPQTAEGQGALL